MAVIEMKQLDHLITKENIIKECAIGEWDDFSTEDKSYFTEAVFAKGKEKLKPLVEATQALKDLLDEKTKLHEDTANLKRSQRVPFNPTSFWKSDAIKEFEDVIQNIFGFRSVKVEPLIEKYYPKNKEFGSKQLNAWVYAGNRYAIDGLVTDDGFYDKTHSLNLHAVVTLGLIKALTAEEIVAIFLHEIGHGIDPALVAIEYTETNIFSKMLTDRTSKYTETEKAYLNKQKDSKFGLSPLFKIILLLTGGFFGIFTALFNYIRRKKLGDEAYKKMKAEYLRKVIKKRLDFNRKSYFEGFADNFPRMYGFGPALISGLHKADKKLHEQFVGGRTWFESFREDTIRRMFLWLLNDEHKTTMHRAHAIIRDHREDLKDPNIPAAVKKQIETDIEELEKVIDTYLNDFDAMSNRINEIIVEELNKADKKAEANASK